MRLKTISLKFMIKSSLLAACCFVAITVNAQEVISEGGQDVAAATDTVQTTQLKSFKVDGVAAVVGDFVILDSDIFQAREGLKQQNADAGVSDCDLLDKLMETKLYAHQAIVDSITVPEAEIRSYTNQQIGYFKERFGGSEERVLKFYRKETMADLEKELFEINKNNQLAQMMQQKIVADLEVTPEEIRAYFNELKDSEGGLPIFGDEVEISKIMVEPEIPQEEKQKVIDELNGYRTDILLNGSSFATKAVLWSEDESTRGKGGLIEGVDRKAQFVKEFRDVAFSLQEGEISKPFETEFGFHIIQVVKIKGQQIDLRHILRIPKITDASEKAAKEKIEKIKKSIEEGELTFSDAAKEFSDEKETASDGGVLFNPTTQDRMFEVKNLPPEIYPKVRDLQVDDISEVFNNPTRTGRTRFEIYTVSKRVNEHKADFAVDYLKIKDLALQDKSIEAVKKWQNEKIDETYIKINRDHRSCDFSNNWINE